MQSGRGWPGGGEPALAARHERELQSIDANLVAYFRLLATSSAGGLVEEGDGYLLFAGAHEYPGPFTNGVVRKNTAGQPVTPAELLARSDAFFGSLGRPYVTWVRSHRDSDLDAELQRRGHRPRPPAEGNLLMVVSTPPADPAEVPGIEVRETFTDEDRREFVGLLATGYDLGGADLSLAESVLISTASLRSSDVRLYVARAASTGRLVAGVSSFTSHGVVQFEWLVVDPSVRGTGIGRSVSATAVRDAFAAGHELGWCMASQQGAPLWAGLGFEAASLFKRYVAPLPERPAQGVVRTPRRRGVASKASLR